MGNRPTEMTAKTIPARLVPRDAYIGIVNSGNKPPSTSRGTHMAAFAEAAQFE